MVAPVPPDQNQMRMRLTPRAAPLAPSGPGLSGGRPPFRVEIPDSNGDLLLVLREEHGRLVAEGDESRWDEAAKRFIYQMLQWSGQLPVRWKDEARKAVEGR